MLNSRVHWWQPLWDLLSLPMTNHLNTVTLKYHLTVLRYVFPSFCPKLKGLPWWSSQPRSLAESTTWNSQGAMQTVCSTCGCRNSWISWQRMQWWSQWLSYDVDSLRIYISWHILTTSLYYQIVYSVCAENQGFARGWGLFMVCLLVFRVHFLNYRDFPQNLINMNRCLQRDS